MNEIIVVEQGRVNWKGEYCVVTYAPVDSIKTAELLARHANKVWRKSGFKIKKIKEHTWEAVRKCKYSGDEVYYLRICKLMPATTEEVKEQIKKYELGEKITKITSDFWNYDYPKETDLED